MKIAIVILNWNGKSLLERFLPSVTAYSEGAEVYVADNASTDGSAAFLRSAYPQVKIVQNAQNYGYAGGYNRALQEVSADVYCLLNSDVEVTPGWLTPIREVFEKDLQVAIVQPTLLDYNRRDYFEYAGAAGGFLDALGYPFCRGRIFNTIERDTGQYSHSTRICWASGACFFVRSAVFWELGGFDADYEAHQEEIDLCWRAQGAGYLVWYAGASTVYHIGGATLQEVNPRKTFLNFRNSLFSLVKNLPKHALIGRVAARLLLDIPAAMRFGLQGKFRHSIAVVQAHGSFFFGLKKMLKKRRNINSYPSYYHVNSIVWAYFIRGKRYFWKL